MKQAARASCDLDAFLARADLKLPPSLGELPDLLDAALIITPAWDQDPIGGGTSMRKT